MALDQAITNAAKKDYSQFEKEIASTVESKMKGYLGGFTKYLEKNTFNKKKE